MVIKPLSFLDTFDVICASIRQAGSDIYCTAIPAKGYPSLAGIRFRWNDDIYDYPFNTNTQRTPEEAAKICDFVYNEMLHGRTNIIQPKQPAEGEQRMIDEFVYIGIADANKVGGFVYIQNNGYKVVKSDESI